MPDRSSVEIPAEQLFYACSCGHYRSEKPGSPAGVSAHQRHRKCGGNILAVLPDDFVLGDEVDAPDEWSPAPPQDPVIFGVTDSRPLEPQPEAPMFPQRGPVADGKVVIPEPGGPTQFRGPATVPAAMYAVYDAFRVQQGYEGPIDQWFIELAEMYLTEVMGIKLVLTVELPNQARHQVAV